MATEIQYKVFKEVFDEEQARYSHLATRASVYLTIITFYVGVVFFKFNELSNFAKEFKISPIWFLLVGLLLIIALLLVVLAISIRTYEGIFDPQKIINSFGKTPPKDEDFLDERIVDLSVATNRNSRQNNRVANLLQWAAYLIFLAALFQLVPSVHAIYNAGRSSNAAQTKEADKSPPSPKPKTEGLQTDKMKP